MNATAAAAAKKPKTAAADGKKKRPEPEAARTNRNFTYNLDSCVVQGTRDDMDAIPDSGQAVVEHVWMMSRPPRLGRGVEPTVTARGAHVMLGHVQRQTIDTGDLICKRVCRVIGNTDPDKDGINAAVTNGGPATS